jgi:hypothetical protein
MPKDWSATDHQSWRDTKSIGSDSYRCGYCGLDVASESGWETYNSSAYVRLCPQCNVPTFFSAQGNQVPGPLFGSDVTGIEDDIKGLYREARTSLSVNAFTGAVMLCRKILMNVSVEKGAKEGLRFAEYVEWLVDEGYAPKGSEGWVKYIKDRGNDANHEIVPMAKEDATGVLRFTEQLLRNMFELPELIPPERAQSQ